MEPVSFFVEHVLFRTTLVQTIILNELMLMGRMQRAVPALPLCIN